MNPTTLLRRARPEPGLDLRGPDERAERELAHLLGDAYSPVLRRRRAVRIRPVTVVNVAVAVLVVAVSVLTIGFVGRAGQRPAENGAATPRLFVTPDDFVDNTRGPLFVSTNKPLTVGVAPNGCITLSGYFLQASKGSVLQGDVIDLVGVGRFRIGDRLWSVVGGVVDWPGQDTAYVKGSFTCGKGTYLAVGEASVTPPFLKVTSPVSAASDAATAQALKTFREYAALSSIDGQFVVTYVVTTVGEAETRFYGSASTSTTSDLPDTSALALVAVGKFKWQGSIAPNLSNASTPPSTFLVGVVSLTNSAFAVRGVTDHAPPLADLGVSITDTSN